MDELTRSDPKRKNGVDIERSPEDVTAVLLCALLRQKTEVIIQIWQNELRRLSWTSKFSDPVLKDDVHVILECVSQILVTKGWHSQFSSSPSIQLENIDPHILQRVEIGVEFSQVVTELVFLREAIETVWKMTPKENLEPAARSDAVGKLVTRALQVAFDRVLAISATRFNTVKNSFLAAIENIVTTSIHEPLETILSNVLRIVREQISEADTAAILIREEDRLFVRAAVGLEEEVWNKYSLKIGEGFSGMIAVERKPRMIHSVADDSLVESEVLKNSGIQALYGVPLTVYMNDKPNVIGVAHIGSLTRSDFSEEARLLFRMIMTRVALILNQALLKEDLDREQHITRMVLDNSPTIIFLKHPDGRYISINRRAVQELGFSQSKWIGQSDHDIFPKETADQFVANDKFVLSTAQPLEKVELVYDSQGRARQYLTIKFPILDSQNRAIAVGGIATDITKRLQWEKHQEFLAKVGTAILGVGEVDKIYGHLAHLTSKLFADFCIIDVLDDAGVITRAESEHRMSEKSDLAKGLKNFPLDRARPHLVQAVLASREPVFMDELPEVYLKTIAQNEDHLSLLNALNPGSMIQIPLMSHGVLFGAWVITRDRGSPCFDYSDFLLAQEVGRLVSLRIDGIRSLDKARSAIQARDEILGVVAHDLRSPLGTIKMATDLLSEQIDESKVDDRELIDTISRSMQRMNGLIGDLLDVASLEAGKFSIEMERLSPNDFLGEIVKNYQENLNRANLSLSLEIEKSLPDIRADRNRVQQIFSNLIDNAIKHTPARGEVALGAEARNTEVHFFVRDTGSGISKEDQESVFDRFWQLKNSERRGVGLGLAICKSIIEAHGGRIWLESKPGSGSTFHFTLKRIDPLH